MNRSGKLHALLSTARVANIPSVVSNVWLGVILGMLPSCAHMYVDTANPPASTAVQVVALFSPDALLEVEAYAVI